MSNGPYLAILDASEDSQQQGARWLKLEVNYDQKQALIELAAAAPLFGQEPVHEIARRSLEPLLRALQEVAATPGRVHAPARQRT